MKKVYRDDVLGNEPTAALLCFAGCGDKKMTQSLPEHPQLQRLPQTDFRKTAVFDVEFEDGKAVVKSKNVLF